MEKKRKLGRGLEEVADFWLSSSSIPSEHTEEKKVEPLPQNNQNKSHGFSSKSISIIYPESSKVKGLLVTNFALELAKQGYGSCILNYGPKESPLNAIMNNLFQNFSKAEDNGDSSTSHRVLKLYGMPGIHLFSKARENLSITNMPRINDDLYLQISGNNMQESIILLNHQDTLEMIAKMDNIPPIVILVSKPRRESLLISYAYIKVIVKKAPCTQVWMIMDEVLDRDVAVKAFTLLSQAVIHRLSHESHPLKFLGSIIHDQALGISLATHYPLVLSEQHSVARDSIIRITANFIKSIENLD
jgi:hypothetical protein